MFIADFELREAYIEGAKAARAGVDFDHNPFEDAGKRTNWAKGYRAAVTGQSEPVCYLIASACRNTRTELSG
jgi:ribosome modulation factor